MKTNLKDSTMKKVIVLALLMICSLVYGANEIPTQGGNKNTWGTDLNNYLLKGQVFIDATGYGASTSASAAANATAIQAANDAADGAVVFLPVGTYAVTNLTIDNCTLSGVSQGGTILRPTGTITVTNQDTWGVCGRLWNMEIATATSYASTAVKVNGFVNRRTKVLNNIKITADSSDVTASSVGLLLESIATDGDDNNSVASNTFGPIIIVGYETGCQLNTNETAGSAFINANVFQSLKLFDSITLMDMTQAGSSAMTNNIFLELVLQGESGTTVDGVDINGVVQKSKFTVSVDGTISGDEFNIAGSSWFNTINGDVTVVDTAGRNTQFAGAEITISKVGSGYGKSFFGKIVDQTSGTRYLLLAQKLASHSIVGTIVGRRASSSSAGENSARIYVNVLSDSGDNNFVHWDMDSQIHDIRLVELDYDGDTWIALDAIGTISTRPLASALFDGQYTEQTDQLTWVESGDISNLVAVASSRITTAPTRLRAVYDVSGGDSGTVAAHGLGVALPDNATVVRCSIEIITAFDSSGNGETVSLGITTDDAAGLLGLSDLGTPGFTASIQDDGLATNYTTKTTGTREIIATVAGETATSGKLILWMDYVVSF